MKILRNEPLKKHTSFKIGGPADYFCNPSNFTELEEGLKYANEEKLPISIIGAGTNLLALDKGFRGMVINLSHGFGTIQIDGATITVGAGCYLAKLLNVLAAKGIGGMEFLAGIPGTVGGAVIMNAGAWGKAIGKQVFEVCTVDLKGKKSIFGKKELKFSYRKSIFQGKGLIMTEIVLKLRKKSNLLVKNKMEYYLSARKETQPLGIPNAGCIFKNPNNGYAGKLLQEAGCKGMRIGDAQISTKHANFIVNLGEAKARDVLLLMTRAQKKVNERFKIQLEPELKIMVEFPA